MPRFGREGVYSDLSSILIHSFQLPSISNLPTPPRLLTTRLPDGNKSPSSSPRSTPPFHDNSNPPSAPRDTPSHPYTSPFPSLCKSKHPPYNVQLKSRLSLAKMMQAAHANGAVTQVAVSRTLDSDPSAVLDGRWM